MPRASVPSGRLGTPPILKYVLLRVVGAASFPIVGVEFPVKGLQGGALQDRGHSCVGAGFEKQNQRRMRLGRGPVHLKPILK